MDAYGSSRVVRVHGAVARPVPRHHGLIGGCSFARDVLNASMLPVACTPIHGPFHDQVSDIRAKVEADTLGEAVSALRVDLNVIQRALRDDDMRFSLAEWDSSGVVVFYRMEQARQPRRRIEEVVRV